MNDQQIMQLTDLDPAVLTDIDKTLRVMNPALRPIRAGLRLLGRARTVRCYDDFLAIMEALSVAEAGDVLVVDTQESPRAVVGELFSLEAQRRGLGGIVIDGGCRDLSTLATLDMPVWCRFSLPLAGTALRVGETQIPVICGGVLVNPGDIVFGDDDGIVVLSDAEVEPALVVRAAERAAIAHMRNDGSLFDVLNLKEHAERVHAGDETSRLQFKTD